MAESFRNFCGNISVTSTEEKVIIPSAGDGDRNNKTCAQVHSIYISSKPRTKKSGVSRYNPANFNAFDLYIKDSEDETKKTYIVYDGRIVPGAPFFIEKNITLEQSQSLWISCPSDSEDINTEVNTEMNSNSLVELNQEEDILYFTASAVLLPIA